jgi:hypothetical protein
VAHTGEYVLGGHDAGERRRAWRPAPVPGANHRLGGDAGVCTSHQAASRPGSSWRAPSAVSVSVAAAVPPKGCGPPPGRPGKAVRSRHCSRISCWTNRIANLSVVATAACAMWMTATSMSAAKGPATGSWQI